MRYEEKEKIERFFKEYPHLAGEEVFLNGEELCVWEDDEYGQVGISTVEDWISRKPFLKDPGEFKRVQSRPFGNHDIYGGKPAIYAV